MSEKIRPATALLSIVVAFYNEEKAIAPFFAEMDRIAATLDCALEYVWRQ